MATEPLSQAAVPAACLPMFGSIMSLAARASIETSTRNLAEIDQYPSRIARGTDVYIAWLPGSPWHHLVSLARRLRQAGMNPVPHIAARNLASHAVATDFLAGLRDEAGVTRALLIAGDSQTAGGFDSSLALLETGLLQAHGIRSIGIAGYPEGHPGIADSALMVALDRKIAYAASHCIDLYVVTQFCFEGSAVLEWLERLRARGINLPARVGIAGPASVRTLLNYAMRCGIGASIRALNSQAISLTRLIAQQGPEEVVCRVAPRAAELGVAGLHVFTFGGFTRSAEWIDNVAAGKFQLGEQDHRLILATDANH